MTSFALNSLLKDPTTDVIVDYDSQTAVISDKTKLRNTFTVIKSMDNSPFFKIASENIVPNDLNGHYSSVNSAIQACCTYLKNVKQSHSVKSEELDKARKARNAAKSQPKGGQLV